MCFCKTNRSHVWFIVIVCFIFSKTALSQESNPALKQRLEEIQHMLNGSYGGYDKVFDPLFLKHVAASELESLFKDLFKKGGPVLTTLQIKEDGPFFAEYRFYTKQIVYPVKIGVNSSPPYLINTLWFGMAAPVLASMDDASQKLKQLPGQVSFALCQLGEQEPVLLNSINPDQALAIGSTFKLYILGALIDEVLRGTRKWADILPLKTNWMSWPSGILHTWPINTPITLASLAAHMLSQSDNTATDHLLFSLGRNQVESMLVAMGNKNAEKNIPFLSTREMFLLKTTGKEATKLLDAYRTADVKTRRVLIETKIAGLSRDAYHGTDESKPLAIDQVEWFASASDLCRAMNWIRIKTEDKAVTFGSQVLSINPGLAFNPEYWDYIGRKGGSEPGVLNVTWLLKNKKGTWYALSAGWNDSKSVLDDERFYEILQGMILLLEKS